MCESLFLCVLCLCKCQEESVFELVNVFAYCVDVRESLCVRVTMSMW